MRIVMGCLAVLALCFGAGCSFEGAGGDAAMAETVDTSYDGLAKQFAQSVQRGDWAAAYAMTTPEFQATTTQAGLQKEYDDLIAEIRKDEPAFTPNMIEIDRGDLPSDEKEAKETYEFKSIPPKSEWKAWLSASMGTGDKDGFERGVEAWLFVVSHNGENKFAHVEFAYLD